MDIGDGVFITNVWQQEGNYENNYRERKKAQVLKIPGYIVEINSENPNLIKYKLETVIHGGEIGFDCFVMKEEAENRVNGLNNYFYENNCLIEE